MLVISNLLFCRRDHPVDSPEKGAGEAAERTEGEAQGEPRPEAGAGSPKGNTGRRVRGLRTAGAATGGLKKEMGGGPADG
jgi:hypothetical protein